jgi:hypothetical protein
VLGLDLLIVIALGGLDGRLNRFLTAQCKTI